MGAKTSGKVKQLFADEGLGGLGCWAHHPNGEGGSETVGDNGTPDGKVQNRRIEIIIL